MQSWVDYLDQRRIQIRHLWLILTPRTRLTVIVFAARSIGKHPVVLLGQEIQTTVRYKKKMFIIFSNESSFFNPQSVVVKLARGNTATLPVSSLGQQSTTKVALQWKSTIILSHITIYITNIVVITSCIGFTREISVLRLPKSKKKESPTKYLPVWMLCVDPKVDQCYYILFKFTQNLFYLSQTK